MRIGLLCGSLNRRSTNGAALDVARAHLTSAAVETAEIDGLADVPPFDAGEADEGPAPVERLRSQLDAVDAVLLAAPEYAAGVAGATKNALDWLVGSATLYHKPMAVMSVGTTGGPHAIEQLVRTLSWQGALVVATLGVSAPRTKMSDDGRITDRATAIKIETWADDLVRACRGSAADRQAMLSMVVASYGIDPTRFGDLS